MVKSRELLELLLSTAAAILSSLDPCVSGGLVGRLLVGGWLLSGQGSDVVDQVPEFPGPGATAFRRHVVVAVLDDIEEFAVGAVFEKRRIGEVGGLDLQIFGNIAFAVAGRAMTRSAVVAVDLLAFSEGLGSGLHRVGLAGSLDRNRAVGRLGRGRPSLHERLDGAEPRPHTSYFFRDEW